IGNYDLKAPPLEMLQFAAPHLADVMELAGILPTDSSIIGHRAVASYKSCPGKMFDMEILRTILRGEM
ncbi:MAG: hypothetical protein GY722_20545, partial [bacterium]|nr:hypothetical protein [bacterium]